MNPSLGRRIRSLFTSTAGSGLELVLVGNAYAAVALGVALLFEADLSILSSLYVAAATFLVLTGFLLFRATVWISACLGGIAIGLALALLLASLCHRIHPLARWPGAAVGFAVGIAIAVRTYAEVGRAAGGR